MRLTVISNASTFDSTSMFTDFGGPGIIVTKHVAISGTRILTSTFSIEVSAKISEKKVKIDKKVKNIFKFDLLKVSS